MKSISESGIYYVTNAVSDKPENSGGFFSIVFANSNTGAGLYVPNTAFATSYKVKIVDGSWTYFAL